MREFKREVTQTIHEWKAEVAKERDALSGKSKKKTKSEDEDEDQSEKQDEGTVRCKITCCE